VVFDNPTAYRVHSNKWSKTNLKWYFSLATNEMKELAQKAFDRWESVSNLEFYYNSVKPEILISFSNTLFQHNHNSRCQKGICSSSFDEKRNVLAHGFFPNNDECLGKIGILVNQAIHLMVKLIFIQYYYNRSDTH
jgi:hypothetical protein